MDIERPLKDVPEDELHLELALRTGPRYQCWSSDCRAMVDAPGKFDSCPRCGRKGYLSGAFVRDRCSPEWKAWESSMVAAYRSPSTSVAA